jgi:LPS sulfotransferase NodH
MDGAAGEIMTSLFNPRRTAVSMYRNLRQSLSPLRTAFAQMAHRSSLRSRYLRSRATPQANLFILAEPRTGSNLLVSYLLQLPGVEMLEEVLNRRSTDGLRSRWVWKSLSLRHIDYSLNRNCKVAGCKLMLHHMRWHRLSVQDLADHYPNAKFIVLYRRDLARQYVSARLLMQTGIDRIRSAATNGAPRPQVRIDPAAFRHYCDEQRQRFSVVAREVMKLGGVIMSYEELAADPLSVVGGQVAPYLGVEAGELQVKLQKQESRELHEIVENYDEVADLLHSEIAVHHHGESQTAELEAR